MQSWRRPYLCGTNEIVTILEPTDRDKKSVGIYLSSDCEYYVASSNIYSWYFRVLFDISKQKLNIYEILSKL